MLLTTAKHTSSEEKGQSFDSRGCSSYYAGPIPEALGALSKLKVLSLHNNQLTGMYMSCNAVVLFIPFALTRSRSPRWCPQKLVPVLT